MSSLVDTSKVLSDGSMSRNELLAAHETYEQLVGLWAPALIETGVDLGLFEAMQAGSHRGDDLARRLGTDPMATRVLLDALYAYGILERDDAGRAEDRAYVLPPSYRACLLPDGPLSLVGKVAHDRRRAWDAWRGLSGTVRHGIGVAGPDTDADTGSVSNQISGAEYRMLAQGIEFWAVPIITILGRRIEELGWDDRAVSVLDVGCGTGLYSRLLLERFPSWTSTGLESPEVAPLCAERVRHHGLDDRMGTRALDFLNDEWGDGHDLVLFTNIFHLQPPRLAERLMLSAAKALAPGGMVCVIDQIRTDAAPRSSPQERFALLFAASMLATGGGDTHHVDAYDAWLTTAGLRRTSLSDTPMHRILLAARH